MQKKIYRWGRWTPTGIYHMPHLNGSLEPFIEATISILEMGYDGKIPAAIMAVAKDLGQKKGYLLLEEVSALAEAIQADCPIPEDSRYPEWPFSLSVSDPKSPERGAIRITFSDGMSHLDGYHAWVTILLAGSGSHASSSMEWSFDNYRPWPVVIKIVSRFKNEIKALKSAKVLAALRLLPVAEREGLDPSNPDCSLVAEQKISAMLVEIDEGLRKEGTLGEAWRPGPNFNSITIR